MTQHPNWNPKPLDLWYTTCVYVKITLDECTDLSMIRHPNFNPNPYATPKLTCVYMELILD